jgi:hypothetical protein
MSQATTISHIHSPQAKRAFGILLVAVAVVASLLTATVLSHSQPTVEVTAAADAPAAPVAAAASPGTGVPEATAVFAGKDVPMEEPAPTF